MNCVFCDLSEIKAREIIRNDLAWAFPTNIPIVPGHLLICPIRHVAKYEDLTVDEKYAIEEIRNKLKSALINLFKAEGFNYAFNEGEIAGQSVPHFHLHILPRKSGDTGVTEYEPRKFLYRPGSRENTPEDELLDISKKIKEFL